MLAEADLTVRIMIAPVGHDLFRSVPAGERAGKTGPAPAPPPSARSAG